MSVPSPSHNLPLTDPQAADERESTVGFASFADPLPLVGRREELRRAGSRLRSAMDGSVSILTIAGEPGIGKTRLARQIADQAQSDRFVVVWARSLEDDWQPHYQIWDDILSQVLAALDWPGAPDAVPNWVAPLVPIVSSLAAAYPDAVPLGNLTAQEEQFRVTDAIVRCLQELAHRQPILIVLDDIQWTDPESLRVLRHLGTFPESAHLMILATVRLDAIERLPAVADLVNVLRREPVYEEIGLQGLERDDVGQLMQIVGNEEFPPKVVRLITEGTQRNPFYVQEMTRHFIEGTRRMSVDELVIAAEAGEFTIPESLRQVVEHRVSRLTVRTQQMLRLAAVCTDGFDFSMLQALTSINEDELLDSIDEALDARLITALEPGFERYDFPHQLVRRALYDTWSPSRRARLHRSLATALERLHGSSAYLYAGQIASHYHISSRVHGAEAGVPFALQAADNAHARFAPDQAATYYRMALEMAVGLPVTKRVEISRSLALAEAEALHLDAALGSVTDTLRLFDEAQASNGEKALFIAAAVSALHDGGAPTDLWTPLLYEGLALVPPEDEITWARLTLLIERFEPLTVGVINGSRWLGSDQRAVEIARASGDEDLFARSLQPWDLWDREWTEQLSSQIGTWRQPNAIIRALTVCGADWLYHHGDFRRARAHFEKLLIVAERQASIPGQAEALVRLGITHVTLGNIAEARALEVRATALVERLGPGHRLHASLWWLRAFLTEVDHGSWQDVAAFFTAYIADPKIGQTTIALDDAALAALALAKMGDPDHARQLLTPLIRILDQLEPSLWLLNGTVGFGAAAVWELKAEDLASPLYHCAIDAIYAGHDDFPCTSNFLAVARMATLMGKPDEARTYFEMARTHLDASGQRPLRAIVDLDEATMLAMQDNAPLAEARSLTLAAAQQFADLGMTVWSEDASTRATGLERQAKGPEAVPAGLTQRELDVVRLLTRGYSDRQISDDLYLSPRTVNAHVRNILAKTDFKNRTELSVWAVEHGLARS